MTIMIESDRAIEDDRLNINSKNKHLPTNYHWLFLINQVYDHLLTLTVQFRISSAKHKQTPKKIKIIIR